MQNARGSFSNIVDILIKIQNLKWKFGNPPNFYDDGCLLVHQHLSVGEMYLQRIIVGILKF